MSIKMSIKKKVTGIFCLCGALLAFHILCYAAGFWRILLIVLAMLCGKFLSMIAGGKVSDRGSSEGEELIKEESSVKYVQPQDRTVYRLFSDALKQPHLLIAGATGSGKSVVIGGLMHTIMKSAPGDCEYGKKVILIDPKRVELSQFRRIPHCIKYACEPDEIVNALQYAMRLSDARYRDMERRGSRRWEYSDVYVVIDEFADLMTTNGRVVKPIIQRLAQVGRAAGIHVILATQTPIVKVLPTEIKCNFDARFGLRTRSEQDSRNIIGMTGLERLPKYGKGYYMTPDSEGYYNIPYVHPDELQMLVDFWEAQVHTTRPAA